MTWQDEFVTVVNESDADMEWDGFVYHPDQRRTVPYLAMCNSYGDPRAAVGRHQIYMASNGERGVIQPREVDRARVQTYWGTADSQNVMTWDTIPRLCFYTMDGDRLYTIVDDPTGERSTPAPPSVEEAKALENTIRRQQSQINQLLQVAGLTKDALPDTESAEIPADIPVDDSTAEKTQSPWAHSEAVVNE